MVNRLIKERDNHVKHMQIVLNRVLPQQVSWAPQKEKNHMQIVFCFTAQTFLETSVARVPARGGAAKVCPGISLADCASHPRRGVPPSSPRSRLPPRISPSSLWRCVPSLASGLKGTAAQPSLLISLHRCPTRSTVAVAARFTPPPLNCSTATTARLANNANRNHSLFRKSRL
jgi:hypothetical protein